MQFPLSAWPLLSRASPKIRLRNHLWKEHIRGYRIVGFIKMRFNTGVLCGISCIELSRVLKLHITTQYIVRRHSLRYGYMDHPFGSECPNILHRTSCQIFNYPAGTCVNTNDENSYPGGILIEGLCPGPNSEICCFNQPNKCTALADERYRYIRHLQSKDGQKVRG